MSRRDGQLTRVALRLGLMIGGVACAWSAYDAVTDDAAYAAVDRPAATAGSTADAANAVLRTRLSAGAGWTGTTDHTKTADQSAPTTGSIGGDTTAPQTSTDPTSGPRPRPGPTTVRTPPRPEPVTAPAHRADPVKAGARPTSSATKPAGGRATSPTAAAPRPVTRPPNSGHGPAPSGPERLRQPSGSVVRPDPAPRTPKPKVDPHDDAPKPPEGGTVDPPAAPTTAPPSGAAAPALTTPAGPGRAFGSTAPPGAVTAGWPSARDAAGDERHPRPGRPYAGPDPFVPSGGTGGVGASSSVHGSAADTSAVAWTPPAFRGHRCRPAPSASLPSRSPRPGSRPA